MIIVLWMASGLKQLQVFQEGFVYKPGITWTRPRRDYLSSLGQALILFTATVNLAYPFWYPRSYLGNLPACEEPECDTTMFFFKLCPTKILKSVVQILNLKYCWELEQTNLSE